MVITKVKMGLRNIGRNEDSCLRSLDQTKLQVSFLIFKYGYCSYIMLLIFLDTHKQNFKINNTIENENKKRLIKTKKIYKKN